MQEIMRQADQYGLPPTDPTPLPSQDKVADLLAAPTPWSPPLKVEEA